MRVLRARLYEREREPSSRPSSPRPQRSQVGTGERAEKIRTYNFAGEPRHGSLGIKLTLHRLDQVLDGDLGRSTPSASGREQQPGGASPLRRQRMAASSSLDASAAASKAPAKRNRAPDRAASACARRIRSCRADNQPAARADSRARRSLGAAILTDWRCSSAAESAEARRGLCAHTLARPSPDRLARVGVEPPERRMPRSSLRTSLGITRSRFAPRSSRAATERRAARSRRSLLGARAARSLLAYVLGEWGFRRLTLTRRRTCARPAARDGGRRRALSRSPARSRATPRVLDVRTGSGAIALAIADEHPGARVTPGSTRRTDALVVVDGVRPDDRAPVELLEWDLFARAPDGPWDLVVSNPPYVLLDEIGALDARGAGVGAARRARGGGLRPRRLPGAPRRPVDRAGALVLEVTARRRAPAVCAASCATLGYVGVSRRRSDLAGRDRVVEGPRRRVDGSVDRTVAAIEPRESSSSSRQTRSTASCRAGLRGGRGALLCAQAADPPDQRDRATSPSSIDCAPRADPRVARSRVRSAVRSRLVRGQSCATALVADAEPDPTRSACASRVAAGSPPSFWQRVGVVAATSANLHGGPDPRRLDERARPRSIASSASRPCSDARRAARYAAQP